MRDDLVTSPWGECAPSPLLSRLIRRARGASEGWLSQRVAYLLRKLAMNKLDGPVDETAFGVKFRLYPFTNICEKRILFTPQYFDRRERELIAARVRPGFVFLDIGANIGGYALSIAALAGSGARILAVEPQPQVFERLTYNIAQNPFGTVKAVACALADTDGEATLFLNGVNRGQASLKIIAADSDLPGQVTVQARSLLSLVRAEGLERIDVAKLDVEGAEDLVLEPFLRDAPRALWPRLLVIGEAEERWHADVHALLQAHGYEKRLVTRRNAAFELPEEPQS